MVLRVVYRSYGGENTKGRPAYYSKLACLVSFLRAAEAVDVDLVFLNDGPVPDDRLRLMRAAGEVVELPRVGMRGSYLAALRIATSGRWDSPDLVWFSEDDYLYRPDALSLLVHAAQRVPEAEYLALYARTWAWPPVDGERPMAYRPAGWHDLPPWDVDGQEWVRIRSTTSTFGAQVGALREDLGIFRLCMLPHRHQLRDHDTSLVFQGYEPYPYRRLARDLVGRAPGSPRQRLQAAALAPFLVATNLRSLRRPARRRLMLAARPNLAAHLEDGHVPAGTDWAAVAEESAAWGSRHGMMEAAAHSG